MDETDFQLRKWCLQLAAEEFDCDTHTAIEEAEKFFQYIKSGKMPDNTD